MQEQESSVTPTREFDSKLETRERRLHGISHQIFYRTKFTPFFSEIETVESLASLSLDVQLTAEYPIDRFKCLKQTYSGRSLHFTTCSALAKGYSYS